MMNKGTWAKMEIFVADARLKVVYSGFAMAFLLPFIYGSNWPEVGWC